MRRTTGLMRGLTVLFTGAVVLVGWVPPPGEKRPAKTYDGACYMCCSARRCATACGAPDATKEVCTSCLADCMERAKRPDCRASECR